jgi:hypothetical protein
MSSFIFSSEYLNALRSAWRHGRSRLIPLGLLFLLLLGAGMGLLHAVFHFDNFQVQAVKALGPDTRIVGIGSSRMFFGIDPRRMPGGYMSLAANYLDMSGAERIWLEHAAKMPHVKLAVIEFGMSTLYYDMQVLSPQALQPLGLDVTPIPADFVLRFDQAVRMLLAPIFRWRLTPGFYRYARRMSYDPDEPMDQVAGHVPSKLRLAQPELYAERKVAQTREHLTRFKDDTFERNFQALLRLLNALDAKGIQVLFVRFPKERHVWPLYDPAWDQNVKDAYAAVWGAGSKRAFFDLSRDPQYATGDFRDPDHLNHAGSQKLSAYLASWIADGLY